MSISSASHGWFQARQAGRSAEQAVARWFRRRGWRPFATLGRESVDLLLLASVEVKHDQIAPTTGQVAIEIECGGRPSGIVTSPADYWALIFGAEGVLVRTSTLRENVLGGGPRRTACGHERSTVVCLFPIDQLVQLPNAQHIELNE